jgi:hypothetical protein
MSLLPSDTVVLGHAFVVSERVPTSTEGSHKSGMHTLVIFIGKSKFKPIACTHSACLLL